jgi:cold shock CspA family protein
VIGSVKIVFPNKGYGFIKTPDGDLFMHVRQCDPTLAFDETLAGKDVQFDRTTDKRSGRPQAINVKAI